MRNARFFWALLAITLAAAVPVQAQDKKPLAEKHEEIRTLLEYRTVQKALTSYGENILNEISPVTGRIHANFHQIGERVRRVNLLDPLGLFVRPIPENM